MKFRGKRSQKKKKRKNSKKKSGLFKIGKNITKMKAIDSILEEQREKKNEKQNKGSCSLFFFF